MDGFWTIVCRLLSSNVKHSFTRSLILIEKFIKNFFWLLLSSTGIANFSNNFFIHFNSRRKSDILYILCKKREIFIYFNGTGNKALPKRTKKSTKKEPQTNLMFFFSDSNVIYIFRFPINFSIVFLSAIICLQ